ELEFAVLRKPFELSDLSRVMAKAIAEAHGANADNVIRLRDRRSAAERQRSSDALSRNQPEGSDPGSDGPGNVPARRKKIRISPSVQSPTPSPRTAGRRKQTGHGARILPGHYLDLGGRRRRG